MRISVGCDHAGMHVKDVIIKDLISFGYEVKDYGAYSADPVDYPDVAYKVAKSVVNKESEKGILICGSGIGMSIAANRFPEIRCSLCTDVYSAICARSHNDANVLAIRARNQELELNREILKIWLETAFSNEDRHIKRIDKLSDKDCCEKGACE